MWFKTDTAIDVAWYTNNKSSLYVHKAILHCNITKRSGWWSLNVLWTAQKHIVSEKTLSLNWHITSVTVTTDREAPFPTARPQLYTTRYRHGYTLLQLRERGWTINSWSVVDGFWIIGVEDLKLQRDVNFFVNFIIPFSICFNNLMCRYALLFWFNVTHILIFNDILHCPLIINYVLCTKINFLGFSIRTQLNSQFVQICLTVSFN